MDAIRCSNSCSAMNDDDFRELVSIARLEHDSRTWLSRLVGLAERLLSKSKQVNAAAAAISVAFGPILKGGNWLASKSHLPKEAAGLLGKASSGLSGERFHRSVVTVTGAAGGFFGPLTAVADVLASTTLVLRSIQEIATDYGEDLSDPAALLDCLMILSKGGPDAEDDDLDEAYWVTRASFQAAINPTTVGATLRSKPVQQFASGEAVKLVLESGVMKKILERFAITTTAAFAEKVVPILGAAAGAAVNRQFMTYYQNMAHVAYRLKRIEARYERDQVRSCYQRISKAVRDGATC